MALKLHVVKWSDWWTFKNGGQGAVSFSATAKIGLLHFVYIAELQNINK